MQIPDPEFSVKNLVDDYQDQEPPRPHFGISSAGHPCERWLWLNFRWAIIEKFPGRILRLFRRGHMEEVTVVQDLRRCGFDVAECLNSQIHLDFGGHVSGSPDGVIRGIPEAPRTLHTLEIKTHSKKSFDKLCREGVEKSKPLHYVQMQCYMRKRKTDRTLYYAVCKDDDSLYTERVRIDKELADKYIARSRRISEADRMCEPLSSDPSWWECKVCPAHDFCFGDKKPQVNCRTCAHSTPEPDGTWTCARWNSVIPVEGQRKGCRSHVIHPDLVKAKMSEYDQWSCYYDGVLVGEAGISSLEFLHGKSGLAAEIFDAEVL